MNNTIVLTEDGSHTLLSGQFGVTYHSTKGSIQESKTVFIDAGLRYFIGHKNPIKILEMGFGTGLNAIMSAQLAHESCIPIDYTGVEAFPISSDSAKSINYADLLKLDEELSQVFDLLHTLGASKTTYFSGKVEYTKIEDFRSEHLYDVIYFDAFAPSSQEELWTVEMMQKMYNLLKFGGILVTYCAKGQFKRNLKASGFTVESLPGPKGKREMTRAIKPLNNLC